MSRFPFLLTTFFLLAGLAAQDSLVNPFTLAATGLPYQYGVCGFGRPEMLSPDSARKVIDAAFSDMGIGLKHRVWVDDGVGAFLDGYDPIRRIGYLFLDQRNMAGSFGRLDGNALGDVRLVARDARYGVPVEEIEQLQEQIQQAFYLLLVGREDFLYPLRSKRSPPTFRQEFLARVDTLPNSGATYEAFRAAWLDWQLAEATDYIKRYAPSMSKYLGALREETGDWEERILLIRQLPSLLNFGEDGYLVYLADSLFSNRDRSNNFLSELYFLTVIGGYDSGVPAIYRDTVYQQLKMRLVTSYPILEWAHHVHPLDAYADRHYLDWEEAKHIDRQNYLGHYAIALIYAGDRRLDLPHRTVGYYPPGWLEMAEKAMEQTQQELTDLPPGATLKAAYLAERLEQLKQEVAEYKRSPEERERARFQPAKDRLRRDIERFVDWAAARVKN